MSTPVLFTDQSSSATGTVLNASKLNALVPATTYLMAGSTPGTSASLTLTYGAQQACIANNAGTTLQYVSAASGTLTMTASSDNYIDLGVAGSYTVSAVSNGASAPSQADSTIRMWKVVTNGTAITAVSLLASTAPISNAMLPANLSITGTASFGGAVTVNAGGVTAASQTISAGTFAIGGTGNQWTSTALTLTDGTHTTTLNANASATFGGAVTANGGLTVAGGATVSTGGLTVSAGGLTVTGHVVSSGGTAPSVAVGAGVNGLGGAATLTSGFNNTDRSGNVSVVAGTSPTAGPAQLCRVTFGTPYQDASHLPKVVITASTAESQRVGVYVPTPVSQNYFDVYYYGTPTAGNSYGFTYMIDG
jgi:hypothetical protein